MTRSLTPTRDVTPSARKAHIPVDQIKKRRDAYNSIPPLYSIWEPTKDARYNSDFCYAFFKSMVDGSSNRVVPGSIVPVSHLMISSFISLSVGLMRRTVSKTPATS